MRQSEEFDITGIPLGGWVDMDKFSDSLVQYLYSRPFSALPEQLREGNKRAQIYLSSGGSIWPVGRGFGGKFVIGNYVNYTASREVRVAQKSP